MYLSPVNLTFDKIHAAYTEVLQNNPRKALRLSDGGAVYLENREIYAVSLTEAGEVEAETAGCISPLSWDDERCCWESEESADDCVAAVNSPVFVDLPTAEVFELAAYRN